MTEIWKAIPDYEGIYEVSDLGNIRSLERYVIGGRGKRQLVPSRQLKPSLDSYGYFVVSLCDSASGRKVKVMKVNRLVLLAFVGRNDDLMALHGDGNSENNRLSNLRYGTGKDNADDRTAHGKKVGADGESNGASKLTVGNVVKIKARLSNGESCCSISKDFPVNTETIRKIKIGKTWSNV